MTTTATLTIAGFITSISPESKVMSIAGVDLCVKDATHLVAGDFVRADAKFLDGSWMAEIDLHLQNPIPNVAATSAQLNVRRTEAANTHSQNSSLRAPPVNPPSPRPSAPAVHAPAPGTSRANRFAGRGSASAPASRTPTTAPPPQPSNARPAFNPDDLDDEIPF